MFGTAKTGSDVITDALAGFTKVSEELEKGIELCNEEECKLDEKIQTLTAQRVSVHENKEKAQNVKSKVTALLA